MCEMHTAYYDGRHSMPLDLFVELNSWQDGRRYRRTKTTTEAVVGGTNMLWPGTNSETVVLSAACMLQTSEVSTISKSNATGPLNKVTPTTENKPNPKQAPRDLSSTLFAVATRALSQLTHSAQSISCTHYLLIKTRNRPQWPWQ